MALIFAAVSFKQASVLSLLPSKHLFSPQVVTAETRLHSGTTLVLLLLVDVAFLKEAADPASFLPPLVFQSRLMEDLVSSKAQLSQLRLEASTQKEKAAELQTKLMSAVESSESESQTIAGLETQLKGLSNFMGGGGGLKISNHSNEIILYSC